MLDLNLVAGKIWPFQDESGNSFRLSLSEALLTDIPIRHDPTPGYLAPIQHELLSSILQVSIDSLWMNGISKKKYQQIIESNDIAAVDSLILEVCNHLDKMKGFNLIGSGAFMQMPTSWRESAKTMPIARLMWPFIPNVAGNDAKGLRRLSQTPQKLTPDQTALFIFTTCTLSKNGSQYWSNGNLAGRLILHSFHGKTMRQNLFRSILPGYSEHWLPLQPLPWIPKCLNNGGLEFDNKPPFKKYLTENYKLNGTGNIRFFQSRAIILDPPEIEFSSKTNKQTYFFTTYSLLSDKIIYNKLQESGSTPKKIKYSAILNSIFEEKNHPSIEISNKNNNVTNFLKITQYKFPKPYWSTQIHHSDVASYTTKSTHIFLNDESKFNSMELSFFKLKYVSKKQDVNGLDLCQHINHSFLNEDNIKHAAILNKIADKSIEDLKLGIMALLQSTKVKNNRNDKTLILDWLLTCSQRIWNFADSALLTGNPCENFEEWEHKITNLFLKEKTEIWRKTLAEYWSTSSLSLAEHKREFYATRIILGEDTMHPNLPYLESKPLVKSGRAFITAYQKLSTEGKARLRDQGEQLYISRFFWECMNAALKEDPSAFQPIYEQIIPLLPYVSPIENGMSLGDILCRHKGRIPQNRVELLLSERDREMLIDQCFYLFRFLSQKGQTPIPLDLGIFIYELKQFHFESEKIIRRWAYQYFSDTYKDMEDENV